jgi:glucan 1,3-beta-glucosidase
VPARTASEADKECRLYSFFNNYNQTCVNQQNCQSAMVSIEGNATNINLYGLSTKAAVSMITTSSAGGYTADGRAVTSLSVLDVDNRNNFCGTVALWTPS